MLNKECYANDDLLNFALPNDGVAEVSKGSDAVLKYELSTFVCEGQYEQGLVRILDSYLANLAHDTQPAAWISGFYGSGKSHLVKMLAYLWTNTPLQDGTLPRDVKPLPAEVQNLLKELSVQAKRHGGIHAAMGKLVGGGTFDAKLALLQIVFRSVGLPESYQQSKFILWLRGEGLEDAVKAEIAAKGKDWNHEVENMLVSPVLRNALIKVSPDRFGDAAATRQILLGMFGENDPASISTEDMIKTLNAALMKDGKMPLTLIVLDEAQQFIGEDSDRAICVQEVAEALSKKFKGRIMLVATGQSALSGTPILQKIVGRFNITVQLSDTDITSVVRQVVLRKKPEKLNVVQDLLVEHIGEISRHLQNTELKYRQEDLASLAADYPVLPTRRRFWERALLTLDATGTDGQLRNLLKMNLRLAKEGADKPLGTVAPADYLFFDLSSKLLQSGKLPREFYDDVMQLYASANEDEKLVARACGLVFLINKVSESNSALGLSATTETLADLMLTDLTAASTELRAKLPALLDHCHALQKIGDEYHVQTKESAEWRAEFNAQRSALKQETHKLDMFRQDKVRAQFDAMLTKRKIVQGDSKTPRDIQVVINKELTKENERGITVYIRDQWYASSQTVREDAQRAGLTSSVVYVYAPKIQPDSFRSALVDFRAAEHTLSVKGSPSSVEGREARSAMESIRDSAKNRIEALIKDMFDQAVVYQGGGAEVTDGATLQDRILNASIVAAGRLYSEFPLSDNLGWATVLSKAQKGVADALAEVGWNGNANEQPLCKRVLQYLGPGKTGQDVRDNFSAAPYGWTKDAIDGALQMLTTSGDVEAKNASGKVIEATKLERKTISVTTFRPQTVVIGAVQKMKLRQLFTTVLVRQIKNEDLHVAAGEFLDKMQKCAESAGGVAPLPETPSLTEINDLRTKSSNDLLMEIFNRAGDLLKKYDEWRKTSEKISSRKQNWELLSSLVGYADKLPENAKPKADVEAIVKNRLLLADPDPVAPVLTEVADILRKALNDLKGKYDAEAAKGEARLAADENWNKLTDDEKTRIAINVGLMDDEPSVATGTAVDIDRTLEFLSLSAFSDKVKALAGKYSEALMAAAQAAMPQLKFVRIPSRQFQQGDEAAVDAWLAEIGKMVKDDLKDGPVSVG